MPARNPFRARSIRTLSVRARSSDAFESDPVATAANEVASNGANEGADRSIRTDGGRNQQNSQNQRSDDRGDDDDIDAVTIDFLDRETVRIVGDLEEVMLALFWWDESGLVGTITEPIGGVDGERTVTASEAFADQEFAHGPIVSGVEGFTTQGPSMPGTGDVSAANPNVDAHIEAVREAAEPDDLEEPFPEPE